MIDGEKDIIRRAVSGESSAFGFLYDQYGPQIFRFVFLRVGHREDAEDLTHRIFVSAWENICGYEERGLPFSSWLYRIARNAIIDHYRSSKDHVPWEELDEEIWSEPAGLEDATELKLAIERARQGLLELRPEYQDVILMRFVEELTVAETAEALGKSEGAVKVMQHRALKELRKILDAEEQ